MILALLNFIGKKSSDRSQIEIILSWKIYLPPVVTLKMPSYDTNNGKYSIKIQHCDCQGFKNALRIYL